MKPSLAYLLACCILLVVTAVPVSGADAPAIGWQKVLGGTADDFPRSINQTSDGGYILTGGTQSSGTGDVGAGSGGMEIWVVRLDRTGSLLWQNVFGYSGNDRGNSIQQTTDGGYVLVSSAGSVTGSAGDGARVLKLDPGGAVQWERTLGRYGDEGLDISQTRDGGYIITGSSRYGSAGVISMNHGANDLWVVKLDRGGAPQWERLYGGNASDRGESIRQTADGGYIIAGSTRSDRNGDVGPGHGDLDVWVVKLDPAGNLQWQNVLGGNAPEVGYAVRQAPDGSYIIVGSTNSDNSGDVGPNHGSIDVWAIKLDPAGILQWQRVLGGDRGDQGFSVWANRDGSYVLAGYASSSASGDVGQNHGPGGGDFWVVKLDASGQILWQKMLGGSGNEQAFGIQQTADGGYVVAGLASSGNDGDVGAGHGANDFWVVNLAPETGVPEPTPVITLPSVGEASTSYQVGFDGLTYNADGKNQLDLDLAKARRSMATVAVYTNRVEIYQKAPDGVRMTFTGDRFMVQGDRITGPVKAADFVTDPVEAPLAPGIVSGSVCATFSSLARAGGLRTIISDSLDPLTKEKIRSVLEQNGLDPGTIAYTYEVRKSSMPPTGRAVVVMSLPESWLNAHGGAGAVRIIRISDATGVAELIPALYNDTVDGRVRFQGISANGTSVFGMITLKAGSMAGANASGSVFPQQQPAVSTIAGLILWVSGLVMENPAGALAVAATAGAAYAGRRRGMW